MKSLAKGNNSEAVFKLIKVLINTQQQCYEEAVQGDTTAIEDIADKLETNLELFNEEDKQNNYTDLQQNDEEDSQQSPYKNGDVVFKKQIPAYVEEQISSKSSPPKESPDKYTGHRSAQFDFLLQQQDFNPTKGMEMKKK